MAALDPSRGRSRGDGLVHEGVGSGGRTDAQGWGFPGLGPALRSDQHGPWLPSNRSGRQIPSTPRSGSWSVERFPSPISCRCSREPLPRGRQRDARSLQPGRSHSRGVGRSATSPRNCGLEDACSRCSRREVMWPSCSAPPAPSTTHAPSSRHRSPTENSGTGVMIERTCSRAPVRDGRGNPGAGGRSR